MTACAFVALYIAWRDHRWLRIRIEPKEWYHAPALEGRQHVGFILRLSAFNPAGSGNALTSVKTWLDGREAECNWFREPAKERQSNAGVFEHFSGRFVVHAFWNYADDPSAAYMSVRRLRVRLEFGRGFYRRRNFNRDKVPAATGR